MTQNRPHLTENLIQVHTVINIAHGLPANIHSFANSDVPRCVDTQVHIEVQGDVAAYRVGEVGVVDGARDIGETLVEVTNLPRPPDTIQVGVVKPEDRI